MGGALQVVGEVLVVGGRWSRVWGEGGGHQRGKRHWERLLEGRRRSFKENIKKKLILNREKISSTQEFHVFFYIIIIITSKNEHRIVNVDDDKVKR